MALVKRNTFNQNNHWIWWAIVVVLALAILIVVFPIHLPKHSDSKPSLQTSTPSEWKTESLRIERGMQDRFLHSRRFNPAFGQESLKKGESPELWSIQFDKGTFIQGFSVEAPCNASFSEVQMTASIQTQISFPQKDQETLFLAPCTPSLTIWYPLPFHVEPDESVVFGASLTNITGQNASFVPDITIYYSWEFSDPSAGRKPRWFQIGPGDQDNP